MKGKIVDEIVKIYAEPSSETLSIASAKKGDELDLGKVIRKKKDVWVEVALNSGQKGYIAGDTKIFVIKKIQTLTKELEMFAQPDATSEVLKKLPKDTVLTATGIIENEEKGWLCVTTEDGVHGFIKGGTKISLYQESSVGGAKKQLISGAVFFVIAAGFYIFTLSQTQSTSNLDFLIMAAGAFGLMQLVQGFLQYRKARQKETQNKKP